MPEGIKFAVPLAGYALVWGACVIYLLPLERRGRGVLRPAAFLVLALALGAACGAAALPVWPALALAAGFCFLFFLCCAGTGWAGAAYCGVWAMLTPQLAGEVWFLCFQYGQPLLHWSWGWLGVGAVILGAVYCAAAFTIARWMPRDGRYRVGPRQLTSALALLALFEILSVFFIVDYGAPADPAYTGAVFLAQAYCVTMLYFQDALFKKSAMKQELQTLNRLWYEQKEQYDLAKETIAIINRKCHDLKHQMAAMRALASGEEREKYLREIEDSVRIYDAIVKTGNEVLDTVLTEKSLYCGANQITVGCVADGTALEFMDPVDVYAVMGNALDNAIESVSRFQDPERRIIDVLVCREMGSLVIQVVNPLGADLTFQDGLPLSTKPHDGYHGFGLKSIRHTVEKYGGFLTVNTENGSFALKILIPLSQ